MPILKSYLKRNKVLAPENKVYFSVSSEGLGHSSRILAIAREFNPENIMIGSYNYAYDRFRAAGFPCVPVQQEIKLIGEEGAFDVGKTIFKNHSWALSFNQLVKQEIKIIREMGASCVVADGRLVPVMAADKLGLPCIVLTNQSAFYPFFATDSALIRVFGKSFDWIMKTWLSSSEEILIPDFPPPYTVCLPNLSRNHKVMKRTRFTGPLVMWDRDEVEKVSVEKRPYVVVNLGGHAYRKPLLEIIIRAAEILPDIHFAIFTSLTTEYLPDNVEVIGLVQNLASYLKTADVVITQAGHSTAMELLTLGKPSIVIPDLRQTEQENNARRLVELGCSLKIGYEDLSAYKLKETIKVMLNQETYAENAEKLAIMAEETKGRKMAAEVIRHYSRRLQLY